MMPRLAARVVFLTLLAYVALASLTPSPETVTPDPAWLREIANICFGSPDHSDKIGHMLAYAALGFFGAASRFLPSRYSWLVVLFLAAYGVGLERLQGLGGVRSQSWLDALANISGAVVGVAALLVMAALWRRIMPRLEAS